MTRENLIKATMRALTSTGWRGGSGGEKSWTCDPAYLVDAAGTDLGISGRRHFYKLNDGLAVGVYGSYWQIQNQAQWYGPILVSTVLPSVYTNQYPGGSEIFSVEYEGLTWYMNSSWHFFNSPGYSHGVLQEFTGTFNDLAEMLEAILRTANVRVLADKGGFMTLWP